MTSWTSGMVGLAALVMEVGVSKFLGLFMSPIGWFTSCALALKGMGSVHSLRVESYLR